MYHTPCKVWNGINFSSPSSMLQNAIIDAHWQTADKIPIFRKLWYIL